MNRLPSPIGVEFYKDMVDKPYYYVDKTLLIKDLQEKGGKVNLFVRPRRFGKTLTLQMLRTFFEQEIDRDGVKIDNSRYFAGTKIMEAGEAYTRQMGQYPVISLSLKSAKQPDFKAAYTRLREEIAGEYKRHLYLLQSENILKKDKEIYQELMDREGSRDDYATSLRFLSECLASHHKRNVVILIDEYDVPLENAYLRGFYDEMIDFICSLFESALKTNGHLELAVITGYLKAVSRRLEVNHIYLTLTIPNMEIRYIYQNTIREWFDERKKNYDFVPFYEGMRTGDCLKIEDFINRQLQGSISYHDSAENFYHGYLLGILGGIGGYRIHPNREQGNGRPDIVLEPNNPRMPAMMIEVKRAQKFGQMEKLCGEALGQISARDYAAELLDEGYQKIYKYGFCFCKKSCMVKFEQV